ncbi:MAG: hypothetical protein ACQESP_04335 [Candidatus Muiribacteriota bacterium]
MNNTIESIFSIKKNDRKRGLIQLCSAGFDNLSFDEIKKIHAQIKKIIDNDSADITFFARKALMKIEEFEKNNNIKIEPSITDEIYNKKASELINLLSADEKLIRINAIYALAKTGTSDEHINALELFAESAGEDEASLAIDSISAIKKFIAEKKKKEKERTDRREQTLKSLNKTKKEKTQKNINKSFVNKPYSISSKNQKKQPALIKFYKLSSISFISIIIVVFIYLTFFLPVNIPKNSKLLYLNRYSLSPVYIYKNDNSVKMIRLRITISGWEEIIIYE